MDERSKQLRRDTIKLMYEHKGSHYGGSLSCIEILIALYDHVMTEGDVFLMSKGHSFWPVYVLLREKGLNPTIEHHPKMDVANGINMTSGSLGHGIPFGIGVALAKKIKGEPGNVYVLCGDGEIQEGTFWESMQIINHLELDNITILVDYNRIQGSNFTSLTLFPLRISGDHIKIHSLLYGNNTESLALNIKLHDEHVLFCQTKKGYGVSFMEDSIPWHSMVMTEEEYTQALKELE